MDNILVGHEIATARNVDHRASDEPRENLFVRRIPARIANVVEAALAEIARHERVIKNGCTVVPVSSSDWDFLLFRIAADIRNAMRLTTGEQK